jgi:hypothetical protein
MRILFASLICFAFATARAQNTEETRVAKAVDKLKQAMIDGNQADLDYITLDQLSYGHSSGKVESKKEFIENIVTGKSDFVTIELTDQTIVVSGKTAIVRHKLFAKTNDGGKPGEVRLLILLVLQKDHKNWKLLARQAVKTPS